MRTKQFAHYVQNYGGQDHHRPPKKIIKEIFGQLEKNILQRLYPVIKL